MGLFFDVLSAINNPNQQANVDQLSGIVNTIQQATAAHGIESAKVPTLISTLGGFLRPVLQQQQTSLGHNQLVNLISQGIGGNSSLSIIQSLLPSQVQQEIIQGVSQKTGINASTVQILLPTLVPAVLSLLHLGASTPGHGDSNALLNTFLNSEHPEEADLGGVLKFANRFLNPQHV